MDKGAGLGPDKIWNMKIVACEEKGIGVVRRCREIDRQACMHLAWTGFLACASICLLLRCALDRVTRLV